MLSLLEVRTGGLFNKKINHKNIIFINKRPSNKTHPNNFDIIFKFFFNDSEIN